MREEFRLPAYAPEDGGTFSSSVRDFLFPGIMHYVKGSFTRYQLVLDLLQAYIRSDVPESPVRNTIRDTRKSYFTEIEPFLALVRTFYISASRLEEEYPWDIPLAAGTIVDTTSFVAVELLRMSIEERENGSLIVDPSVFLLPKECCYRCFGSLVQAVYLLDSCRAETIELRQSDAAEKSGVCGMRGPGIVVVGRGKQCRESLQRKRAHNKLNTHDYTDRNKCSVSVQCKAILDNESSTICISLPLGNES